MTNSFNSIRKEHIISALTEIDEKSVRPGRHSSTYDLEFNGRFYPPKYVLSLASKYATGTELEPNEFEGGEGSEAFKVLRDLGFQIVPKKQYYTWVHAHYKIADWIQHFENRQHELVQVLKEIGITVFKDLEDGDREIELSEIDPFTFFCYIYKYGPVKRLSLLQNLCNKLKIEPLPQDELGLPSANAQSVWLFSWKKDRKNNEIQRLWNFFKSARNNTLTNEAFADLRKIERVGKTKITEGLFYIDPNNQLPINAQTRPYLKEVLGIDPAFETYDQYKAILAQVRAKTDEPFPKISYDAWVWNNQSKSIVEEENSIYLSSKRSTEKAYWLYAPGEGGSLWEEMYNQGIMAIGWDYMGDLNNFSTREEIRKKLVEAKPGTGTKSNNSLCLWEFSREIKPGDIVIAKKGQREYVGYGIVTGNYTFDDSRDNFKNTIQVDWKKKGNWYEPVGPIVVKTLTDISKYPEYVERLKNLIGIERPAETKMKEYYWLNANSKYWKIDDHEVGQEQSYTTHNERGNKRNRFEYFQRIKLGDMILGYQTTPIQKVLAVFETTEGAHIDEDTGQEVISFKIEQFLANPVSYEQLKSISALQNSEVMKNNQGSLFKLTEEEYQAILDLSATKAVTLPIYTIKDAAKEIFMDKEKIQTIVDTLEYKKNIILQGPPGVGKTFVAKRLAYLMMGEKDDSKIEMVQFHQSYSYEDFIQGYRPTESGSFKLENGVFYRFCKKAQADQANDYFFVIDEINRGNLSKVFGELMLLIEADKRGPEYSVALTYSSSNENRFFIPPNVYIIGTMNTADRSLAVVDYAFRRRFAFITLNPCFNDNFRDELLEKGVNENTIELIIQNMAVINKQIEDEINLGKGFQLGHSYFCNIPATNLGADWYNGIIDHEIAPILQEYWFDQEEKAKLEIDRLYIK